MRPFVIADTRRHVRRALYGQGMGRHKPAEIVALGTRSIAAIAEFLGAKAFLMGTEPMGIDATIFSFVAGTLCPQFNTPLRTAAERYPNLSRYVGRMTARFYPDRREIACCSQMMVCAKRKIVGQIAPFTIRNLSGFLSRASIGNLFSQMLIAELIP